MSPAGRTVKQSEIVARLIIRQIVDEGLPEGARLPTEKLMLEDLQVGRSTLREALRLLENQGVLVIRAGRDGGPIVRRPKPSDLGDALTLLLQFERTRYSEIFAARRALEPTLARLAAQRIKPKQLMQLKQTIDLAAEAPDNSTAYHDENLVFHRVIAEAAGNTVLRLLSQAVESVADGLAFGGDTQRRRFTQRQRQLGIEAHRKIYDALERRDGDAAESAMAEHLADSERIWLAALSEISRMPVQVGL